jgi:hypothetical protein
VPLLAPEQRPRRDHPGLIIVLLILRVARHGTASHPSGQPQPGYGEQLFTHHLRRVTAFGLILVGGFAVLAVLRPGDRVTPVRSIEASGYCRGRSGGVHARETVWVARDSVGMGICSPCWCCCPSSTAAPAVMA